MTQTQSVPEKLVSSYKHFLLKADLKVYFNNILFPVQHQ